MTQNIGHKTGTQRDVVIIGGGHNGLVCAAYLARAGLDVLVLERREIVGGACITEELFPGCKVSTYSYVTHLLQPKVVADLGLRSRGFELLHSPMKRFFPWPDGRAFRWWVDKGRAQAEIAALYGQRDADGFQRLMTMFHRAGAVFSRYVLSTPPTVGEVLESVSGTPDEAVLRCFLEQTPMQIMAPLIAADELRAAAVAHIVDPRGLDEPGVFFTYAAGTKINQFVDGADQGLVVGGMGALSRAMAEAARELGVEIRCGAEVAQVLVGEHGAEGVELSDGTAIRARVVISNADPQRTLLHLLPAGAIAPAIAQELRGKGTTCATMKFHALVDELPDFSRHLGPDLDPAHICFTIICPSTTYYRTALDEALAGRPSRAPVTDIQIPTVLDDSLAPPGMHLVSLWTRFAPVEPAEGSWDALRKPEGERLIDLVTEYAPNFRRSVRDWLLFTPADLQRRASLSDGNFRHIDHSMGKMLAERPLNGQGYGTPIAGLYLCGAGTHPGGDVTGAPGHNAAHRVLGDLTETKA